MSVRSQEVVAILRECKQYDYVTQAGNILNVLDCHPRLIRKAELGGHLLWWAAAFGSLELLRGLFERGVDVNAIDPLYAFQGHRAIVAAANDGHVDVVRYLVEQGSDINWESQAHPLLCSPLLAPVREGNFEVVRVLIEAGGLINAIDNNGKTPLDWAEEMNHRAIADYLISRGAVRANSLKHAT